MEVSPSLSLKKSQSPSPQKEKSEKEIQKEILAYLKAKGVFAWTDVQGSFQHSYNTKETEGQSDIQGILSEGVNKGRFLGIEVKARGGKLRPKQELWLNRARESGAFVFIAFSLDDVITTFKEHGIRR